MHSQAPQDLWLPTGWPSSVTSGWSAQCTPQTLNKLYKSYTLHIGMVCTPPISQVYPTICTKCAHCTEGQPYVTPGLGGCAKFAHITHSTNCTYPTYSSLCWRYIAQCVYTSHCKFVAPTVASFWWLSSMWTILSRSKRVVQFILPLVALWASSNPQIHYSCWWYVSHMYILRKNKKQIYIETHSKLCARSVVELKNLSLRWAPCWSDSSQEPFPCDTGAGYDLGNPFQFRSDRGTKDECVRIDKSV